MNNELERYFNRLYRNSTASFIPEDVPDFKDKAEIEAWFYKLEKKNIFFTESIKNLKKLEQKSQQNVCNLMEAINNCSDELTSKDKKNTLQSQ